MELRRTWEREGCMKIHLALSDEEPDVSRLWALTFDMRIGSAVVKMGGIGGVGTNEEYRMRGYARLVMEESTRYFAETGRDVVVLFGITDFYHKFGYVPALPVTTLTVQVQDALRILAGKAQRVGESKAPAASTGEGDAPAEPGCGGRLILPHAGNYTVCPLQESDWGAVLDIYHANNRTRTGTLLRPRETWRGYRHGTEWRCQTETFVVIDGAGEIVGYLTFDDVETACRVGDLGYQTPAVFITLLAMMVKQAQRRNVEEFEVKLPPDHPFVIFCRRCGGAVRTVYHRNGGGMARIIGLRSLFEKLTGLLTERLAGKLGNWGIGKLGSGVLEVRTDLGAVRLEINEGHVRLADPPRIPLLQRGGKRRGDAQVERLHPADAPDAVGDGLPQRERCGAGRRGGHSA